LQQKSGSLLNLKCINAFYFDVPIVVLKPLHLKQMAPKKRNLNQWHRGETVPAVVRVAGRLNKSARRRTGTRSSSSASKGKGISRAPLAVIADLVQPKNDFEEVVDNFNDEILQRSRSDDASASVPADDVSNQISQNMCDVHVHVLMHQSTNSRKKQEALVELQLEQDSIPKLSIKSFFQLLKVQFGEQPIEFDVRSLQWKHRSNQGSKASWANIFTDNQLRSRCTVGETVEFQISERDQTQISVHNAAVKSVENVRQPDDSNQNSTQSLKEACYFWLFNFDSFGLVLIFGQLSSASNDESA
jgi:hypothetical protein